eukprot:1138487-Prorocentrum_minimum.AAC.1
MSQTRSFYSLIYRHNILRREPNVALITDGDGQVRPSVRVVPVPVSHREEGCAGGAGGAGKDLSSGRPHLHRQALKNAYVGAQARRVGGHFREAVGGGGGGGRIDRGSRIRRLRGGCGGGRRVPA